MSFTARKTATPAQARVQGWMSCPLTRQQNYLPHCDFESHGSNGMLEVHRTGQSCPEGQMLLLLLVSTVLMLKRQHRLGTVLMLKSQLQQGNQQKKVLNEVKNQLL